MVNGRSDLTPIDPGLSTDKLEPDHARVPLSAEEETAHLAEHDLERLDRVLAHVERAGTGLVDSVCRGGRESGRRSAPGADGRSPLRRLGAGGRVD